MGNQPIATSGRAGWRLAASLLVLFLSREALGAGALPVLNIDPESISVSGLSSGGFMAVQFQVAFSRTVMGAGVLAGGPYDCAEGEFRTAASTCSCAVAPCSDLAAAAVARLTETTRSRAAAGEIDPTSGLARQRVWAYRGTADTLVRAATMDGLIRYYLQFIPSGNLHRESLVGAEHAMPTDSFGNACPYLGDPYINKCRFAAARALLEWIYGPLKPNAAPPAGRTIEFDQSAFISSPLENGMAETGWIYVPEACANGRLCRLHVAFHGCKQYQDYTYEGRRFGTTFVDHAGYKEAADANDIVVLFPQATKYVYVGVPLWPNPDGCWDWWGYTNSSYADKDGPQMAAVKRMVDRVANLR